MQPTAADLRTLHEHYVHGVNAAVETEDLELARELSDIYTDEALELISAPC
jgi:hypothetical protein